MLKIASPFLSQIPNKTIIIFFWQPIMYIRNLFIAFMILLLASCASTVTPMQPGDVYYEKNLKVEESYIVPPTVLTLGFTFPVGNYKAVMKDDNGTYFAATSPLLAKDWMVGSVYRNGGIYYKTNESAYLYVVDTINFGGARVDNEPLTGLKFKITK